MLVPLLALALLLPICAGAQVSSIAENGNSAEEYFHRGVAYSDERNYDSAIEDYNSALKIKPDYIEALFLRCYAYYQKRSYNLAIEDCSSVLKLNPEHVGALFLRGIAYSDKQDFARAIVDLEAVMRLEPNNAMAKQDLSVARSKLIPVKQPKQGAIK
jgi:tetratricopeptide (TPR) repeat protein